MSQITTYIQRNNSILHSQNDIKESFFNSIHLEQEFSELLIQLISRDLNTFCSEILEFIAQETKLYNAVFFVINPYKIQELIVKGTYGILLEDIEQKIYPFGEGLIGQVGKSEEKIHFSNLAENKHQVEFSNILVSISDILILPLIFNNKVYGVLELTYIQSLTSLQIYFLEQISYRIAASLEGLINAELKEALIAETKAQKEEIEKQEQELREALDEMQQLHYTLEVQNQEIDNSFKKYRQDTARLHASIIYAQRIQEAILPSSHKLSQMFQEHFVFYQPKDVVSGDFYWCTELGSYQFVAAVDCTGHGVPGAFMSMIANTLLNQIIIEKNIIEPKAILNQLNISTREALKQDTSNNKDGLNLVLCRILRKKYSNDVVFSGAKTNLYYYDNDVKILKGDRQSIGGYKTDKLDTFTQEKIQLKQNHILYLMSDGWLDTSNEKRKSYGKKRWEQKLSEVAHLPIQEQGNLLVQDLKNFQGDAEQRDDITLLTIKL